MEEETATEMVVAIGEVNVTEMTTATEGVTVTEMTTGVAEKVATLTHVGRDEIEEDHATVTVILETSAIIAPTKGVPRPRAIAWLPWTVWSLCSEKSDFGIKLTGRMSGVRACTPFIQYVGPLEMASKKTKTNCVFFRKGHLTCHPSSNQGSR